MRTMMNGLVSNVLIESFHRPFKWFWIVTLDTKDEEVNHQRTFKNENMVKEPQS